MRTLEAVNSFLSAARAKGLAPDTIRWYHGILIMYSNQEHSVKVKPKNIETFLSARPVGDERRYGYYRALSAFYRFLERRRNIKNPMVIIDPPRRKRKQPKPLTPDELDQLLSYPHEPKIKAALLLLADTGCRVSEAALVEVNDITETPWGYVVRVTGKTGARLVPLSHETYFALLKALPFGFTRYRFRRKISQAFMDARVKGSGLNLRHTFGTLWEGDELALQQIMGHAHLSTTRIYRAMRTEYISKQHRLYSPLRMVAFSSRRLL